MSSPDAKRPRGRPRLPPEAQRRRLLDAAIRAFEKRGYELTRISDIVGEAGMSSRSFYELFSSKEDLVANYVEQASAILIDRLRSEWKASATPLESIDRGVTAFLEVLPAIRIDLDALGGEAGRRARDARRNAVREVTRHVVRDLEKAHEKGRLATPPDPLAVELVMTGIETMCLRYFAEGRLAELAPLRHTFVHLLTSAGLSPARTP